mgnify:CR=1 FL=1
MTAFEQAWAFTKDDGNGNNIPDANEGGECYDLAGNWVCENPAHTLVHAEVTGQGDIEGIRYGHAFAEYLGDHEGKDYEGEGTLESPIHGLPMMWVYDPSADARLPADLYYRLGQIDPNTVLRYSAEEALEQSALNSNWGPWGEAKNWLHSGGDIQNMLEKGIIPFRRKGQEWVDRTPGRRVDAPFMEALRGDLSGRMPSKWQPQVKHPGSKSSQAVYAALLRNALARSGAEYMDDPTAGALGHFFVAPPKRGGRANEIDQLLAGISQMNQQLPGGLDINWGRYTDDMGDLDRDVWRQRIKGPGLTDLHPRIPGSPHRKVDSQGNRIPYNERYDFSTIKDTVDPSWEGSLNYYLWLQTQRDLSHQERMAMIEAYYMNKMGGRMGGTRMETGYNSFSPNTGGAMQGFPDVENLSNYKPFLENVDITTMDAKDFLEQTQSDQNRLLATDFPYYEEGATYDFDFDRPGTMRLLEERVHAGQPIISFDAGRAIDQYRDIGMDAIQIGRKENIAGGERTEQSIIPETVAVANIENVNARSLDELVFNNHRGHHLAPHIDQIQPDLFHWLDDDSIQNMGHPFEIGWSAIRKEGY